MRWPLLFVIYTPRARCGGNRRARNPSMCPAEPPLPFPIWETKKFFLLEFFNISSSRVTIPLKEDAMKKSLALAVLTLLLPLRSFACIGYAYATERSVLCRCTGLNVNATVC